MIPIPTETGFIEFKGWCPFKFENKHQQLNGNQRAIDWYQFLPTLL
jgi:hypothetical protein